MYKTTFKFFDTEDQAKVFCNKENLNSSRYIRKHRPATYTPWRSSDGKENKFVAWYLVK